MRPLPLPGAAALALGANGLLLGLPLLLFGGAPSGPVLTCLLLALLFSASEAGLQRGQDSPLMQPDRATLATGLGTLLLFWCALLFPAPIVSPVGWVGGAALMLAGITLRALSLRALGPRFVSEVRVLPPGTRVESGLYRLARHPSEVGLLLLGAGAAIMTGSLPAAGLMAGLLLPLGVLRTRREDLGYAC